MSSSTAPKTNYMFVPRTLKPVQIDKMTVKLYPVVDSTMKPPERAHAFQINKTALAAPGIDRRVMLDTLGAQLNLSAIVDGVLGDWTRHFQRAWCNFHHLTILSFHNDAGAQVNDTTTADSAVLLPVIDGHVADCRKKNIRFVRVQLNLDFASLVTLDPPGVTVLRVEFYIELPQSSRDLTNGSGTAYRLTTFLGPDDIRLIPAAEFSRDILAVTLQDGPIDLLRPDFNLTSAKTDSTTIAAEINSKIIRLATPSILDHLFNQLCPGYSKEPHAALDHSRQTYVVPHRRVACCRHRAASSCRLLPSLCRMLSCCTLPSSCCLSLLSASSCWHDDGCTLLLLCRPSPSSFRVVVPPAAFSVAFTARQWGAMFVSICL